MTMTMTTTTTTNRRKFHATNSTAVMKKACWLLVLSYVCFLVGHKDTTWFLGTTTTTTTTKSTTTLKQHEPPPQRTIVTTTTTRRRRIHTCTIGNTTIQIPMTAPHFIIIGSQKSGSSALFQYLMDHPDAVPTLNYQLGGSSTNTPPPNNNNNNNNAELTRSTETHFFDIHMPSKRQTSYKDDDEYWCHVSNIYAHRYFSYDILLKNAIELEHLEEKRQQEEAVAADTIQGNDNHHDDPQQLQQQLQLQHHYGRRPPELFSFEKTPVYMTDASRLPHILKSVLPWMNKIVVTLRDPIDRAYSAFNMGHGRSFTSSSTIADAFHTHTLNNLNRMVKVGLVKKQLSRTESQMEDNHDNGNNNYNNSNDNDDNSMNNYYYYPVTNLTMAQEHEAYRKVAKLTVARGLYEIQLRQWAQVYPLQTHLHVINFNTFAQNNNESKSAQIIMYRDLLQFLEVRPHSFGKDHDNTTFKNYSSQELFTPRNVRTYNAPMHNKTRTILSILYRHYNERLSTLLGNDWGVEEWK